MALQSVRKQNIGDLVYNQFMDALVSGEWKPGERIPSEHELSERLKVSRISVRGALQKLVALGLIESRQGEGTFVCQLNGAQFANNLVPLAVLGDTSLQHLLEFRAIIDCEIAALAAVRATDSVIQQLKENYQAQMSILNDHELTAYYDMEFHSLLACASENPLIIQTYTVFKDVFNKSMYDVIEVTRGSGADIYHARIIQAIEKRDAVRAREEMHQHIQDTMNSVLDKTGVGKRM